MIFLRSKFLKSYFHRIEDCHLHEVDFDTEGFPAIFGSILAEAKGSALDKEGFPTIFGSIMAEAKQAKAETKEDITVAEAKEAMAESKEDIAVDDDNLPNIKPINPNVRSRKLQVTALAKALAKDGLAKGVAPTSKRRLKPKKASKANSLKATMIKRLFDDDPQKADAPKKESSKKASKRVAKRAKVQKKNNAKI